MRGLYTAVVKQMREPSKIELACILIFSQDFEDYTK